MKCIKDKCKYYREHNYYSSHYVCELIGSSYSKDDDTNCEIDSHIDNISHDLYRLKAYSKFIKRGD